MSAIIFRVSSLYIAPEGFEGELIIIPTVLLLRTASTASFVGIRSVLRVSTITSFPPARCICST